MNLPHHIKIGWRNYSVLYEEKRTNAQGDSLMGEILHTREEIFIDRAIPTDHKNVVTLHEVIHAFSYIRGHKLSEFEVDMLSESFYELMRDNIEWFEEILKHLKEAKRGV